MKLLVNFLGLARDANIISVCGTDDPTVVWPVEHLPGLYPAQSYSNIILLSCL